LHRVLKKRLYMVFENSVPEPLFHRSFYFLCGIRNPEVTASMFTSDRFTIPTLVARQIPVRLVFSRRRRSARYRQITNYLIFRYLDTISRCQTFDLCLTQFNFFSNKVVVNG
jgi:hypothetical protein